MPSYTHATFGADEPMRGRGLRQEFAPPPAHLGRRHKPMMTRSGSAAHLLGGRCHFCGGSGDDGYGHTCGVCGGTGQCAGSKIGRAHV